MIVVTRQSLATALDQKLPSDRKFLTQKVTKMDSNYKSYIIYVLGLEGNSSIIQDFLSNDMQIILKETLFFTEVKEHINPSEWFEEDNKTIFEEFSLDIYYIDFIKFPQKNSVSMYYDDNGNNFNLAYDKSTKNKDYLFLTLLYNFLKKMLLLCNIEVESFENTLHHNYPIKTEADIALFLGYIVSSNGFEKGGDMIKYLTVPYTDAIKIKGFPEEWLI